MKGSYNMWWIFQAVAICRCVSFSNGSMIGDEVGKDSRASYNGLELARTSVVREQYKGGQASRNVTRWPERVL